MPVCHLADRQAMMTDLVCHHCKYASIKCLSFELVNWLSEVGMKLVQEVCEYIFKTIGFVYLVSSSRIYEICSLREKRIPKPFF